VVLGDFQCSRVGTVKRVIREVLAFDFGAVFKANNPRHFSEFMALVVQTGGFRIDENESGWGATIGVAA
jgi:hypothetical protein